MATVAPQRHLLTVPETAARLRVSPQTIYRLVERRQLPAMRVGMQIRIDEAALEAWLHAGTCND